MGKRVAVSIGFLGLLSIAVGFINWSTWMPKVEWGQAGYGACLWSSTYAVPIAPDLFRGDPDHIPCHTSAHILNGIGALLFLLAGIVAFVTSQPDKVVSAPPPYDVAKWNALLQYDADIKRIYDALVPFGRKYVDEFAQAFMALNDKNYLPQIVEQIVATAKSDAARGFVAEGQFNSIRWRKHPDGTLEGKVDGRWTAIASINELGGYTPSSGA
jgi:hypothetical protein